MGTTRKLILLGCLTIITGLGVSAQVATLYSFTQFQGTYSAITGGTLFNTSTYDDEDIVDPVLTPLAAPPSSGQGLAIGFNFTYNNIVFDRVGISMNGYINLGNSINGATAINIQTGDWNRPISGTSTMPANQQHRIAALGNDMQGTASSSIRIQTLGTAPTRTCVIQWANQRRFNVAVTTSDDISFQIRLYETTNIIDVIYGTVISVTEDTVAQIGLRGGTNLDFNNRSISPPNVYATSVAGTSNTYFGRYNSTLTPVSGQTYRWSLPQCSGTLAALTSTAFPDNICSGQSALISLLNTYTVAGITYTWSSSATGLPGSYVAIPNSNSNAYNATNLTTPTWFQVGATCINSAASATSTGVQVQVQGTTINSVPYYEGFEGIPINNKLPDCSWSSNALGTTALTYTVAGASNRVPRTGFKFASFYNTPAANQNYFYTSGIQLNAGVTYSAGLWYTTDFLGSANWTDLSLLVGPNQSTTGLSNIVSATPAISGPYKALGGTFTVATSGLYYIAIRGVGSSGGAPYLSWDDLSVTIPCSIAANVPNLAINSTTNTICHGSTVDLLASGADTYTWSTGSNNYSITVTPDSTTTYVVMGSTTLTGCPGTTMETIVVLPSPTLTAISNKPIVCPGTAAVLNVFGAGGYVWTHGATGNPITVNPTSATSYTVTGYNVLGCAGTTTVQVATHPNPTVAVTPGRTGTICKDDEQVLTATGGISYIWASSSSSQLMQGSPINVTIPVNSDFTITATDANSCMKTVQYHQDVQECTGLEKYMPGTTTIFPNPTSGPLTVKFDHAAQRVITLSDLSGRVIHTAEATGDTWLLDAGNLSSGIYFLQVQTEGQFEVVKLIKQ